MSQNANRDTGQTPVLIEGVDYYIENGRWVFTSVHHLKRGECCKNVCRHCPYGNSPSDRARLGKN